MKPPTVQGLIRRRILVSFRVDPEVMQRQLPPPFRPKLLGDAAVAGLCLIRLEQMRPQFIPLPVGAASENAAHRVAVCWTDAQGEPQEGVYIPRRDTDSLLNRLAGGRLFPGHHYPARFDVRDEAGRIDFSMRSADGEIVVRLCARVGEALPATSRFASLEAASAFYQAGAVGFSPGRRGVVEGVSLSTTTWLVEPLVVEAVSSSYFADERRFPRGSVVFDSALLMRDIPHAWHGEPGLTLGGRNPRADRATERQEESLVDPRAVCEKGGTRCVTDGVDALDLRSSSCSS
jgi:hypothetical protein